MPGANNNHAVPLLRFDSHNPTALVVLILLPRTPAALVATAYCPAVAAEAEANTMPQMATVTGLVDHERE
jgi:hypothetical protein